MRLELAGGFYPLDPIVLIFTDDETFNFSEYITSGYVYYDVICIGGGGGMGGGIDTNNTGTLVRNYGGAGGGGGYHRARGLLSALPTSCPIVVGAGGTLGTEDVSNPANTTDGGDGGYSSFNDTTCHASGGKGGKRAQSNSTTVTTQAHGGEGGIGDSSTAGGGAAGGTAGTPTDTGPGTPGTDGIDGILVQNIGKGGGGGAGGVGKYVGGGTGVTCNLATHGGKGSYDLGDMTVYGIGGPPRNDPDSLALNIRPGFASGARTTPLSGLATVYGQSNDALVPGDPGVVIVRLTSR